jgi:chromosome segregation ATPase
LLEVTQKLYKLAAEYLSRRKDGEAQREARLQEQRMIILENELNSKKREFNEERREMQERLSQLEKERAILKANDENYSDKMKSLKEDKKKFESLYNELLNSSRSRETDIDRLLQERMGQLEKRFENNRSDFSSSQVQELEKQKALLDQEVNFSKREMDTVMGKMKAIETENNRLKSDVLVQEKNNEVGTF